MKNNIMKQDDEKKKKKNKGRLGLPSSVVDATFEAKKKTLK